MRATTGKKKGSVCTKELVKTACICTRSRSVHIQSLWLNKMIDDTYTVFPSATYVLELLIRATLNKSKHTALTPKFKNGKYL
jgi:hypothetical protein